jgi:hypothetical protein
MLLVNVSSNLVVVDFGGTPFLQIAHSHPISV